MNRLSVIVASLFALLILLSGGAATGCGGGSGSTGTGSTNGTNGDGTVLTGRVVSIVTGGPVTPAPSVQTDEGRVTASADGSFAVDARAGTETVLIDTPSFGVFSFTGTAVSEVTTDLGDLYVGPQRVTLTGILRSGTAGAVISGGTVTFGGRRANTDANGRFTLSDVAYAPDTTAAFLGIVGTARAPGFIAGEFTTQGRTPTAGALDLGEVLLTPESDPSPPGLPFTIFGTVSPFSAAPGTVVSLRSGTTEVRRTTVGNDATYGFWVAPGTYTVTFTKGTRTAGPFTVTLADTTSVVPLNATLP